MEREAVIGPGTQSIAQGCRSEMDVYLWHVGFPMREGALEIVSGRYRLISPFCPGPVPILLFLEMLYRPVQTPELPCGRAPVVAAAWVWGTEVTSFCGYICVGSNLFLL